MRVYMTLNHNKYIYVLIFSFKDVPHNTSRAIYNNETFVKWFKSHSFNLRPPYYWTTPHVSDNINKEKYGADR